ncbi:MAG: AbrB/MazE/SpoVT family DNA-binding domain-containing protein [Terriglobales bacterium]|jgi:antitoxin MazE
MSAKAQMVKWGNSLAVRIPKVVAEEAELNEGDELVIEVQSRGALAVKAARKPPTLDELIADITPQNLHRAAWSDDGPVGNEAW